MKNAIEIKKIRTNKYIINNLDQNNRKSSKMWTDWGDEEQKNSQREDTQEDDWAAFDDGNV